MRVLPDFADGFLNIFAGRTREERMIRCDLLPIF